MASGLNDYFTTASPFDIKTRLLTTGNFGLHDVRDLYAQHTADMAQVFTPETRFQVPGFSLTVRSSGFSRLALNRLLRTPPTVKLF